MLPALLLALIVVGVIRAAGPDRADLPETVADLMPACEGTLYPDAPAYTGTAPHPIVVFYTTPGTDRGSRDPATEVDQSLSAAWRPNDPHQVQAVACVNELGTLSAADTCYYVGGLTGGRSGIPFAMMDRRYRITVFGLRDHRQLRQVEFTGADAECPATVSATSAHLLYTRPTVAQFVDAIGRFVDG